VGDAEKYLGKSEAVIIKSDLYPYRFLNANGSDCLRNNFVSQLRFWHIRTGVPQLLCNPTQVPVFLYPVSFLTIGVTVAVVIDSIN